MLGKENRYFYTRHPNNNDRWIFAIPIFTIPIFAIVIFAIPIFTIPKNAISNSEVYCFYTSIITA
jgi:hypothetical protein